MPAPPAPPDDASGEEAAREHHAPGGVAPPRIRRALPRSPTRRLDAGLGSRPPTPALASHRRTGTRQRAPHEPGALRVSRRNAAEQELGQPAERADAAVSCT